MKKLRFLFSYLTVFLMFFSIFQVGRTPLVMAVPTDSTFMLRAQGRCGYVVLEWTPVQGAERYYIYRGVGEGGQHSMPLTDFPINSTVYHDGNDIQEGVRYCYYIRAIGQDNREFLQSTEACAVPTCSSSNPCEDDPVEEDCELSLKYQVGNQRYWVNDQEKGPMEAAPEIRWQRMFLVIRFVTQEVGAEIGWEGATRTVTIVTGAGNTIQFQIGNPKYKLNGVEDWVDPNNTEVAPYILAGRTMIPLRRVGEALDAKDIIWHGEASTAELLFEEPGCDCEASCPYPVFSPAQAGEYDLVSNCDMRYMGSKTLWPGGWADSISPMRVIPHPDYLDPDDDGDGIPTIMELARNGACMMYGTTSGRWRSPDQSEISVYRHKFCTAEPKEIEIIAVCWGTSLKVYQGNPLYTDDGDDFNNPLYEGKAGIINFTFTVPAGTHYLYFEHHIEEGKPAGLIYGGKFSPVEDLERPPLDLSNVQHCDGVYLFCGEVVEPCVGDKVKVQTPSGDIITVDIAGLSMPGTNVNLCGIMQPGTSWYFGGQVVGNEFHASYLHLNEESCEREEIQRLRCLCVEIIDIDRETYTITALVDDNEMKFSYFGHQNQWLWSTMQVGQIREGHCYKIWVVSKPAYIPPKIFFFQEVECPCADELDCHWTPQGRIVSTRYDEADRIWVVNFLTCDDETMILYTPIDLFDLSGTYPISQAGELCVRFCLDPERKKIVQWEVLPEPCCPQEGEKVKLCGCIVRMTLQPDAQGNYKIFINKDCNPGDTGAWDIALDIPATLLDNNLGIDALTYFDMMPGTAPKNNVCVDLVYDSASMVVLDWSANPGRVPCCDDKPKCNWTENGYIVEIVEREIADGAKRWIVKLKDCDGNIKDYHLGIDPNQFFADNAPDTPISQAGDHCVRLCLRQIDVVTHVAFEVVAWELVDGDCCPKEGEKIELCGCIVRMTLQPDAQGNYKIYIKKDCQPGGTAAFDIALDIPATLLDNNMGIDALTYFDMMPGQAPKYNVCVDLVYDSANMVVLEWWANPDRVPCCDDEPKCEWIENGYIAEIIEREAADGSVRWIVKFKDCDGNILDYNLNIHPNTFFADNAPNTPISQVGDHCVKLCIRQIDAITHVAYEVIAWEMVDGDCCPQEDRKGRIQVKMPRECLEGTVVYIYDVSGNVVWRGEVNDSGIFDTECILPCPGRYKVVPENENCTFSPESREVIMSARTCCDDYIHVVEFKCDCDQEDPMGRIQISMPRECWGGTIIHVYEGDVSAPNLPRPIMSGRINPTTGFFDTGCRLPCPGTYTIIPENPDCTFEPERRVVTMTEGTCCDYIHKVDFKCNCEQEERKGRLQISMPRECLEGTIVYVYDADGNGIWRGRANSDGIFDTGCVLPCPGLYKVVPQNENCTFYPEAAEVRFSERMCCDDYIHKIEFKCECKQEERKGRIQVSINNRECWEGTVINIHSGSGNNMSRTPIVRGRIDPRTGVFDTECELPCPGVYTVIPSHPDCKFDPEQIVVTMTERTCCDYIHKVEFKCECKQEERKGRLQISMPRECLEGTIVYVYDADGNGIWRGRANSDGIFDTGCVLPCPGLYKVVPQNENCTFYPEAAEVRFSERMCCDDYIHKIEFKCECKQEERKGRIQVSIDNRECWEGTTINIYEGDVTQRRARPNPIITGRINPRTGLFDTECKLPCPGTYTIIPSNPNCKFDPEHVVLTMSERTCCEYIHKVEFKCKCEKTDMISRNLFQSFVAFFKTLFSVSH